MNVVSIKQIIFRVDIAIYSCIWPLNTCLAAFWSTSEAAG